MILKFDDFLLNEAIVSDDYFKDTKGSILKLEIYQNPKWIKNFRDGSKAILDTKTNDVYIVDSVEIFHVQLAKKLQDLKLISINYLTGDLKQDSILLRKNHDVIMLSKTVDPNDKKDIFVLGQSYTHRDLTEELYEKIFDYSDFTIKNKLKWGVTGYQYMDEEQKREHSRKLKIQY
jgi:hypothetical protein